MTSRESHVAFFLVELSCDTVRNFLLLDPGVNLI